MTTFAEIAPLLEGQAIEVPSWAYGNSGTRFKVFGSPGTPRTVEEKIADAAKVHRFTGLAPSVALHIPWDLVDDFAALRTYAEGLGVALGHDQLQHLPGRRLQARRPDPHRPEDPPEGDRPPLRVRRRHGRDRVAGPEDLAGRGVQLPGPGRHARPPGPAGREPAHHLRPARRAPAAGARVQVLRAGVLPHGRARLGHVVRAGGRPRRAGRGLPRHRPPRARDQHRVHRRPAAAAREARLVRLQQPLLRRRRPHRRRGRPVPAVPHPLRVHPRRRLRPGQRRGVHARPVPQRREEDPRADPLGAQRAGDDRPRAARRPGRR